MKKPGRPKNGKNAKRSCLEKAKLIEEYYNSGKGYKLYAQEHGISPSLFYGWIQKYSEGGVDALRFKSKASEQNHSEDQIIAELKILIAEQQLEIQRLKKMMENG